MGSSVINAFVRVSLTAIKGTYFVGYTAYYLSFYITDNNGMNGTEGLVAGLHVAAFSCYARV